MLGSRVTMDDGPHRIYQLTAQFPSSISLHSESEEREVMGGTLLRRRSVSAVERRLRRDAAMQRGRRE